MILTLFIYIKGSNTSAENRKKNICDINCYVCNKLNGKFVSSLPTWYAPLIFIYFMKCLHIYGLGPIYFKWYYFRFPKFIKKGSFFHLVKIYIHLLIGTGTIYVQNQVCIKILFQFSFLYLITHEFLNRKFCMEANSQNDTLS